mgnify:CR=1 FL=1
MDDIAIKVDNISKMYKLYDNSMDRLKEALGVGKKKRKLYKEHYALQNVSFDVCKGETVGIIGTNGAGKSTILKIITGVLNQTEGKLEINGRISALLELGAGFNMDYTGIENVYLNGTMIGFSKSEIDEKLHQILDFADIGEFIYQPVKTYSSGMFVRLAFAVAINIDPEILIVDEALSVGDVFFQAKCYKKFEEFKKMGKTILFVSHDLSSISRYCDRVILLNKGKKLAEGKPNTMIDMYKKVLVNQIDDDGKDIVQQDDKKNNAKQQEKSSWKSHFALKGSVFSIKMKVKIYEDIKFPIFAFTIKTLKGVEVTGTNSMFEHIQFEYGKGDIKEITFTQKMDLQGGEYLVSLGCTGYDEDKFEVYHRLYDVCHISVVSDKNTVGFYDMNSKITIR